MATIDHFIASLEKEFGEQGKGKPFEVFCKWFLQNDPKWSKIVDSVWLWDEYPNKWQTQDLGTDLVFVDKEGLTWAVQAKCYSEHRTTTKSDMNSFLADTGRSQVDRRLWIQTTNRIEAKAAKTLAGQDKPVTLVQLNDFREAPIEYPSSFSDLSSSAVKEKPRPEPHQLEAINSVNNGLRREDRGQLIMACGTGKTFTTLWIKEALEAETTLVLLPSLSLLSQTMREWAWAANSEFEILNVCSDKSVGRRSNANEDLAVADAPFPVTSEINEIRAFIKKRGPKVLFCTYQSSELISEAQSDPSIPSFDLAIADEAHRCAGKADAGFATILDGSKIRSTKHLFTTATPRYFGKPIKDAAKARSVEVIGMDDIQAFGPVLHKLSFGEAIERELLTDYQVLIVGVDEPMVKAWIDNEEIVSAASDHQDDARNFAAKIALIKAVKDHNLERVISFHSNIKRAREFSEELPVVLEAIDTDKRPSGRFLSDYVSGEMKAGDRKEKIDQLKKLHGYDRGILTNARCLAEGVDVPSLDGVAFIDPRGSQVNIIQAVGRAIRKVRGAQVQKKGTIVLPVFIEDGDDPEAAIEASNFKPVWEVLKALKAHDETLDQALSQYRTDMAKDVHKRNDELSDNIIFDLPLDIDPEFSAALRTVLVEATTSSWDYWYGLLEAYVAEAGDALVSKDYVTVDHKKLGSWVSNQRSNKEKLLKGQVYKLEALSGWYWNRYDADWELGLNALEEFINTYGHSRVPYKFTTGSGFRLGAWVNNRRTEKKDGRLSNEKLEQLDSIENWVWHAGALDSQWEQNFETLEAYVAENHHARVPTKYVAENGLKIGQWVSVQRQNYEKGTLSDERVARLVALDGWVWNKRDAQYRDALAKLRCYIEQNDEFPAQSYIEPDGFRLGVWVNTARRSYHSGSLPKWVAEELSKMGIKWEINKEVWEQNFSALERYITATGDKHIPKDTVYDGTKIGAWLVGQRQKKKKDKLTPDEFRRLDSLGFHWQLRKTRE